MMRYLWPAIQVWRGFPIDVWIISILLKVFRCFYLLKQSDCTQKAPSYSQHYWRRQWDLEAKKNSIEVGVFKAYLVNFSVSSD